MPPNRSFVL
eukprot:CCRYP_019155-RA/>CCRYP_019155-RA protein AED:0.48 eAED:1.00 QI:0/-1/0/1/-1/0/1/0/9